MLLFKMSLSCGMIPPLSDFMMAVLSHYGIQVGHLSPGAICYIAVFAHLCEMFVGVRPSVGLFRHFFSMRTHNTQAIWGACNFHLHPDGYINHRLPAKFEH